MTKRQGIKRKSRRIKSQKSTKQRFLEVTTLTELLRNKKITQEILKYQWDYYAELALQRNLIQDEIKQSLIQNSIPYKLQKWQRAVKYKYSLHPLSTQGSLTFIGGRFNTGREVNQEIPSFPGLYLAQNKDTALQEHLGQEPINSNSKLTARELALTNPASESIVSVSGKLDKVFDLTDLKKLNSFFELIKNFKISKQLIATAKKLKLTRPNIVNSVERLRETILEPNWRFLPVNFDISANSQIFGHLIYSAGIEGILYPSKFTKIPCLVVFPRNFLDTESFIVLDDEPPHPKVPTRLDSSTWRMSEMDLKEIQK